MEEILTNPNPTSKESVPSEYNPVPIEKKQRSGKRNLFEFIIGTVGGFSLVLAGNIAMQFQFVAMGTFLGLEENYNLGVSYGLGIYWIIWIILQISLYIAIIIWCAKKGYKFIALGILLGIVGIPLLLFGSCILFITGGFLGI